MSTISSKVNVKSRSATAKKLEKIEAELESKRPAAEKEIKRTLKEKRKLAKTRDRLQLESKFAGRNKKKRNICSSEELQWKRQDFKINQTNDRRESSSEDEYFDF